MDEITIENKARLFDWMEENIPHTVMDAIMDFMYTDNRELYDMIYPPEEDTQDV